MTKRKQASTETFAGGFSNLPHRVQDAYSYWGASAYAKALLMEILRQRDGKNNGHMHLARGWLANRGWDSHDTMPKARDELIERGLIQQTKKGGLNAGPHRYAVTWLDITDYSGLDIRPQGFNKGAWALLVAPKKNETSGPPHGPVKAKPSPPHGPVTSQPSPPRGPVEAIFDPFTGPPHGHYVGLPSAGEFFRSSSGVRYRLLATGGSTFPCYRSAK